jgi:hypothetical protein
MMEAIRSPDTSVLTRVTQRYIIEDGILHSHRRENLKSYTVSSETLTLLLLLLLLYYIIILENSLKRTPYIYKKKAIPVTGRGGL